MSEELKPCPFCGHSIDIEKDVYDPSEDWGEETLNNEILKCRNARLDSYNKAVDDTIKAIKEEYAFTILEEEKIEEIAEQLKGAKQNEDFKQEEVRRDSKKDSC